MFLERSARRLPKRNDPSVERSEIRQQSDAGRRDCEETRGHQCGHHGQRRKVSRFECNERRASQGKLSRRPKGEKERRRGVAAVERPVETFGKSKNKFKQHKHHVHYAQGDRDCNVHHTGNIFYYVKKLTMSR